VALTIDEEGQARTAAAKVRIARRLIHELLDRGIQLSDILVDALTFPIGTGQEETRRDALETLTALSRLRAEFPPLHLMLGVSNVSFGLAPTARVVLNSVFLDQAVRAGLDAAIVRPGGILPLDRLDPQAVQAAEDLVFDRRRDGYDPLLTLLELTSDTDLTQTTGPRLEDLAPLERLAERLISGNRAGLEADVDAALAEGATPLGVINDHLLPAMEQVGELFGQGRMQLPFVLQSAEVMKAAVAHLEPLMAQESQEPKGTVVLATVAGDVHDIGKNLVDIVLSNNGYQVRNIGIKQSIGQILAAARESNADAIGMSGLLVKSTQVMRQNLEEMVVQGLAQRWPVFLGGAALTRRFVEEDLAPQFPGRVYYSKDAFECLRVMNQVVAPAAGPVDDVTPVSDAVSTAVTEPPVDAATPTSATASSTAEAAPAAASAAPANVPTPPKARRPPSRVPPAGNSTPEPLDRAPIPVPPFWGVRRAKGIPLQDYLPYLDKRTLFEARWGLKAGLGSATVQELAQSEGEPRLAAALERIRLDSLARPQIAWGYFPVRREGQSVVILESPELSAAERARLEFPRQPSGRRRSLVDYIDPEAVDVLALQVVTMGEKFSEATAELFTAGDYRSYLELHGVSVELAEALAQLAHQRIRSELGLAESQGQRYSLGYPACPDLGQRRILFQLLEAEALGLALTEADLLEPEQSTDAMVFHHPAATYFSVKGTP
jgi:5-methyltetrahydrofolate--homocysteine methyltransferase